MSLLHKTVEKTQNVRTMTTTMSKVIRVRTVTRLMQGALVALLVVAFSLAAKAQGGSNYSVFGFGDLRQNVGAAYDGLGGSSYGVSSDYVINTLNPAAWSFVRTTRVQGGYRFNQNRISSASQSISQNNGKLDGAMILFALDTSMGLSACVGLAPSSSVNYIFNKPFSISYNGSTYTGTAQYSGSGSMITAYFGGSIRALERTWLGISGLLYFGSISDKIIYSLPVEGSFNSENRRRDELSALGVRIGVLNEPTQNLKIGASITLNGSLKDSVFRYYYTNSSLFGASYADTVRREETSSMPMTLGFGASYLSGKFLFAADAEFQSFSGVNYREQPGFAYTNASRFSVGISRLGVQSAGTAYFDRINFNFGAGIRTLYYTVNGNTIGEQYASFGMQMPFGGAAMVDVALTGGIRGTTSNNLLQEQFLRFTFALSVGETWFVPFKRD